MRDSGGVAVARRDGAEAVPSGSGVGKARQGLAGSLLWLANGEWAHIPLTGASLTARAGQLSVVVRPSSGKEDKKVKLSLLGITATHILPGVLSSHLDTEHRFFKEGAGAKNLREFDGDAPVRLLIGRQAGGKLELVRYYGGGGKEFRSRDVAEVLDGLNRGWSVPIIGPGVQTQEYPFWGVRRLEDLLYISKSFLFFLFCFPFRSSS